eukprot:1411270-Pyramimonas_sp.AAC.1
MLQQGNEQVDVQRVMERNDRDVREAEVQLVLGDGGRRARQRDMDGSLQCQHKSRSGRPHAPDCSGKALGCQLTPGGGWKQLGSGLGSEVSMRPQRDMVT